MTGFIPKEKLTAYQRWELAAFDEARADATRIQAESSAEASAADSEPPEATTHDAPIGMPLPTVEEIERIHSEAHESGYAAGYAEGLAAGTADGTAQTQVEVTRMCGLLEHLNASMEALEQNVAEQLLALAIEIASEVLRQSLRLKPELVLPVVREALAALPAHHGHPLLLLHPDDATLVRAHLGEQLAHNNWRIVEDSRLLAGGCRVELGASEVDATLQTRWRRVVETLGAHREWLDTPPAT